MNQKIFLQKFYFKCNICFVGVLDGHGDLRDDLGEVILCGDGGD